MFDGRLVRLRAFEQTDLDANHAFMNDYATLRDMLSGLPLPASYEDERRWLDQQTSYTRGEYQFAIEDGGGDLVGRCGLIRVDWKNRVGEIGIMIGAPYRGRWLRHGGHGAALPLRLSGDESPQAEGERFRLQQGGDPLLRKVRFHPRRFSSPKSFAPAPTKTL